MSNGWSNPTDWATVCKRNAGRRHYNSMRSLQRTLRRFKVVELLGKYGILDHGVFARIARELGFTRAPSRATSSSCSPATFRALVVIPWFRETG